MKGSVIYFTEKMLRNRLLEDNKKPLYKLYTTLKIALWNSFRLKENLC